MKKNMMVLLTLIAVLVWGMPVMVMPAFAEADAPAGVADAGNKLCPVSGNAVSGKDFVTYQGKRYGLCCPKCESAFLSDPGKYKAPEAKEKQTPQNIY